MNKKIYIYTLINPLKNEVFYVGFTCNIKKRYNAHLNVFGKSSEKNPHKNNVIKKILNSGFKPEMKIIDECNYSYDLKTNAFEHEKLEIYYIKKYREEGITLTNITNGGEGGAHNKKRVFQYSKEGEFIAEYSTVKEIADKYGVVISVPSHSLNQRKRNLFKQTYLFTSHEIAKKFNFIEKFKIVQYDLKGNFVSEYNSQREASKKTNISSSTINSCLKGRFKQTGDYYWFYSNNIPKKIEPYGGRYSRMIKPIFQYDLNHNLIGEFKSITSAATQLKLNSCNITMNLKGKAKTTGGFCFKYKII